MKPTNKLKDILKDYLNWDKRRIDCFVKMLISLIAVQTVNLTRLANYMGKKTTNIAVRYLCTRQKSFHFFFALS